MEHGRTGDIFVKGILNRIYDEHGYRYGKGGKNDPEGKYIMEQESRKRALAHIPLEDRKMIDSCRKRLGDVGIGESSALQILAHLGIFLSASQTNSESGKRNSEKEL